MRIAYVIDHLRRDGTQRVLSHIVAALSDRGHSQAVLCLNDSWDISLINELKSSNVSIDIVGKSALASGRGVLKVYSWLKSGHWLEKWEKPLSRGPINLGGKRSLSSILIYSKSLCRVLAQS